MTARDILIHTLKSNNKLRGFSEISNFGVDVLENMMNKYARSMCVKQREICVDMYYEGIDKATNDVYIPDSISNAPYPADLI